jgi:predicted permease
VALGIPLVGYVYGPPGLVVLFTLISVHSLVLVSMITLNLEWHRAQSSRQAMEGPSGVALWATLSLALRQSIFHPVPMPILLGLAFSQTGWTLPEALDRPLQWLGAAFGPMALLLVGINLAQVWRSSASANDKPQPWRKPIELTLLKNMVFPLCVGLVGWAVGLQGVPWAVMVLAAALPVGANVFLVSQRYALEREAITLGMSLSTVVGMLSLPVVMVLLQHWG